MIGNILLALDGSANSLRALDIAAELAGKLGAELSFVHVLMHGRPPKELMRMAEVEHLVEHAHTVISPRVAFVTGQHFGLLGDDGDSARTARAISIIGDRIVEIAKARCSELGAKVGHASVRNGEAADEILAAAEEYAADMIVLGSRGLGLLTGKVLGSVSQKVLHHAQATVTVVR